MWAIVSYRHPGRGSAEHPTVSTLRGRIGLALLVFGLTTLDSNQLVFQLFRHLPGASGADGKFA